MFCNSRLPTVGECSPQDYEHGLEYLRQGLGEAHSHNLLAQDPSLFGVIPAPVQVPYRFSVGVVFLRLFGGRLYRRDIYLARVVRRT